MLHYILYNELTLENPCHQVVVPILIASTLVLSLIGVLVTNIANMDLGPKSKTPADIPELTSPAASAFSPSVFASSSTRAAMTSSARDSIVLVDQVWYESK